MKDPNNAPGNSASVGQNMESHKKNMQLIENKLTTDNIDPVTDLENFLTWIQYFESETDDRDPLFAQKKQHFVNDSLPKCIRGVLRRKYLSGPPTQFETARNVLTYAAHFIAALIATEWEGVTTALADLFDPTQPFYQKYGYPKPAETTAATATAATVTGPGGFIGPLAPAVTAVPMADEKFLNELNMDDVVDYFSNACIWETGVVSSFPNDRMDIEILNVTNDNKEVLSIRRDGWKIAPAFTRVNADEPPPLVPIQADTSQQQQADTGVSATAAVVVADETPLDLDWLSRLSVGNVVDVQNKAGVWYQACILDIRNKNPPAASESAAAGVPADESVVIDMSSASPTGESPFKQPRLDIQSPTPTRTTPMVVDGAEVSLGDIVFDMSSAVDGDTDPDTSGVQKENIQAAVKVPTQERIPSNSSVDESVYSEIVSESSFVVDPQVLVNTLSNKDLELEDGDKNSAVTTALVPTYTPAYAQNIDVRVSFIGFPEKNDEWICLYSKRILPLNSVCANKRGDLPTRDEVFFVTSMLGVQDNANLPKTSTTTDAAGGKNGDNSGINNNTNPAVNRAGLLYSPFYVDVVNAFVIAHGFGRTFEYLQLHTNQEGVEVSESTTPAPTPTPTQTPSLSQLASPISNAGSFTYPYDNTPTPGLHQQRSPFTHTSLAYTLDLLAAVGRCRNVLSQTTIQVLAPTLIQFATHILTNFTFAQVRNLRMESVEAVLAVLEGWCVCLYGRNAQASLFEHVCLQVALFVLDSPFLNKRLGGLKLITDLMRRCSNAQESTSVIGLKATTSYTTTDTTSASGTATTQVEESVSYRVVPVVYTLTLTQICERIVDSGVLVRLLRGDQAHYSLVARAGEVFKALTRCGMLRLDLLEACWEAGRVHNMAQAYTLLAETISVMDLKLLLEFVQSYVCLNTAVPSPSYTSSNSTNAANSSYVSRIDVSQVTNEVVDVISAIGVRARHVLLLDNANSSSENIHLALQLHQSAVSILWSWATDCNHGSAVAPTFASTALSRLEGLCALGAPMLTSCVCNTAFPWHLQFSRTASIVTNVISALSGGSGNAGCNVCASVSVLQACINAWPAREDFKVNPAALENREKGASYLQSPTNIRTKSEYAEYLEATHGVIALTTKAVISNRLQLEKLLPSLLGQTTVVSDTVLTAEQAKVVNNAIVDGGRSTYKDTLDALLNFLHMFVRCSDPRTTSNPAAGQTHTLTLPRQCVGDIWNHLVLHPITEGEVNAVMSFISRIIMRNMSSSKSSSAAASSTAAPVTTTPNANSESSLAGNTVKFSDEATTSSAPATTTTAAPASVRRINVSTLETIHWVFTHLLCGSAQFIQSPYFTGTAQDCIEKYFRWINSVGVDWSSCVIEDGPGICDDSNTTGRRHIQTPTLLRRVSSDSNSPRHPDSQQQLVIGQIPPLIIERNDNQIPFVIVGSPGRLLGLDVFYNIILHTHSDAIAATAVKFLTTLPKRLSAALVQGGELSLLRSLLLEQCLQALQELNHQQQGQDQNKETALKRLLMLLDGLVEEASQDTHIFASHSQPQSSSNNYYDRLRPHGACGHGETLTLTLNFNPKQWKAFNGAITVQSTDTLAYLLDLIAARASGSGNANSAEGATVPVQTSSLKLFRMGKEIDPNDKYKTLAQLKVSKNETILVGEKPTPGGTSSNSATTATAAAVVSAMLSTKSSTDGNNNSSNATEGASSPAVPPPASVPTTAPATATINYAKLATSEERAHSVPFASLPQVVLSHSKQHFELLFSLLNSCPSSSSVCDDVWELVNNRLPTAPFVLKNWLLLESNNIEQLLLPDSSFAEEEGYEHVHSSSHSLSFLLYSLQVIDTLMQPAKDAEDLRKHAQQHTGVFAHLHVTEDIGKNAVIVDVEQQHHHVHTHTNEEVTELVYSWPQRFFEKGGVNALLKAFAWISELLEHYCCCCSTLSSCSSKQKLLPGVTPALLLQTLELLSTMLQSMCVRAVNHTQPGSILPALMLNVVDKLGGSSSGTGSNKKAEDGKSKAQEASSTSTAKQASRPNRRGRNRGNRTGFANINVAGAINRERALIANEWGWRIGLSSASSVPPLAPTGTLALTDPQTTPTTVTMEMEKFVSYFFQELEFSTLQRFVVLVLTLVRPFSRCELFSPVDSGNGTYIANERTKASARRVRLLYVLQRLFVCWICGFAIKPAIASELRCSQAPNTNVYVDGSDGDAGLQKLFSKQLFDFEADVMSIHIDVLVNQLLLGGGNGSSRSEIEAQLADAAEKALLCMITSAARSQTLTTADGSQSRNSDDNAFVCSRHLKQQLFQSVLVLRPPLIHSPADIQTAAQVSATYGPMFSLASKIFESGRSRPPASTAVSTATMATADAKDNNKDSHGVDFGDIFDDDDVGDDDTDGELSSDDDGLGKLGAVADESTAAAVASATRPTLSTVTGTTGGDNNGATFLDDGYRARISLDIYRDLVKVHAAACGQEQDDSNTTGSGAPTLIHIEGTLSLLCSLISGCTQAMEALYTENIIPFVLRSCLGIADFIAAEQTQQQRPYPILCNDDDTRVSAYSLLRSFCQWRADIATKLFHVLSVVHNNLPPPQTFGYKPEKEAISRMGYVGIRNMGCTCYMNSLLQVLFNIPEIQTQILLATTNRTSVITSESGDESVTVAPLTAEQRKDDVLTQLQNLFIQLKYSETKMVSPDDWVYAYKDDTGVVPINVMHQQDAQEFLQVLTDRLEQSLQAGELPGNNSATFRQRDVLKNAFCGKLCNMMINTAASANPVATPGASDSQQSTIADTETNNVSYSSHVREQNEGFSCISVEVKGISGLEESLRRFVSGETISDFIWEENKPRVNITKHVCISELSDTLIFHLKRFELNYDTLRREKVNDSFSFPKTLDMKPYTREYLLSSMQQHRGSGDSNSGAGGFREDDYYEYELRGVIIHTGTSDSGHYYSLIKAPAASPNTHTNITYTTTGSSTSNVTRQWLEFNDSEVKEFHESQLDSECFGGHTVMHEISSKAASSFSMENQKNAYMLVYTRRRPRQPVTHNDINSRIADKLAADPYTREIMAKITADNKKLRLSVRVYAKPHLTFMTNLLQDVVDHDVRAENQTTSISAASAAHAVTSVPTQYKHLNAHILAEAVLFSTLVVARCASPELFVSFNKRLQELLLQSGAIPRVSTSTPFPQLVHTPALHSFGDSSAAANAAPSIPASTIFVDAPSLVLRRFIASSWMEHLVLKLLIHCTDGTIRMSFSDLLCTLISMSRLYEGGDDAYGNFPAKLLKVGTISSILNLPKELNPGVNCGNFQLFAQQCRPNVFNVNNNVRYQVVSALDTTFPNTLNANCNYYINYSNSSTQQRHHSGNGNNTNNNSNNSSAMEVEDAELAYAIRLSQTESKEVKNSATAAFQSFVTETAEEDMVFDVTHNINQSQPQHQQQGGVSVYQLMWSHLSLKMILELTMEWRLILLAEHWRKADAYTHLLKELCSLGSNVRFLLVVREVVWQLIDIFLGDNTPVFQEHYPKGSRKRCPSSYISIGPPLKTGALPSAAKTIPDWSDLIATVTWLVTSSMSFSMVRNPQRNPPTLKDTRPKFIPRMEAQSADLAVHKQFTATIFKQARYTHLALDMFAHQSYLCEPYIAECASCLFDAFSLASYDSMHHLFTFMERNLLVRDDLGGRRAELWINGQNGVLNGVLQNIRTELSKNQDLYPTFCVIVRGIMTLAQRVPAVKSELSRMGAYQAWAPWVLKHIFQYKEQQQQLQQQSSSGTAPATASATAGTSASNVIDLTQPATATSTTGSTTNPTTPASLPKGPYLVIYGEEEHEREWTWAQRSEQTFQRVREVVNSFGVNADTLIPEDAFMPMVVVTEVDDPELAAAKEASVMSATEPGHSQGGGPGGAAGGIYDGMTDAELAAYFSNEGFMDFD